MASSLAASGPAVVASASVSFVRCSERLRSFSSSKVSSLDQRFRISAFVPVVLMGIQLELSTAARWGTGASTCGDSGGRSRPGGPCFGLSPQVLTEAPRAFKERGQRPGMDGGQEPKG